MQSARVRSPDWENPTVFGINKRDSHVPLRSHASPDAAAAWFLRGAQPGIRMTPLNGSDWKFHLFEKPAAVPPEFYAPSFDANGWGKVRIWLIGSAIHSA